MDLANAEGMQLVGFKLIINPGQNDYAKCAGTYMLRSDIIVRDKPVYICDERHRLIFYAGKRWVVTNLKFLETIKNGGTGGFYRSNVSTTPIAKRVWSPRYKVRGVYEPGLQ